MFFFWGGGGQRASVVSYSKMILGGNFEIAPLEINSHKDLWPSFFTPQPSNIINHPRLFNLKSITFWGKSFGNYGMLKMFMCFLCPLRHGQRLRPPRVAEESKPSLAQKVGGGGLQGLRWPGDSQRESGRFSRIDSRRKPPVFITCQQFERIASKLRFAITSPPERDSQKRGSVGEP